MKPYEQMTQTEPEELETPTQDQAKEPSPNLYENPLLYVPECFDLLTRLVTANESQAGNLEDIALGISEIQEQLTKRIPEDQELVACTVEMINAFIELFEQMQGNREFRADLDTPAGRAMRRAGVALTRAASMWKPVQQLYEED